MAKTHPTRTPPVATKSPRVDAEEAPTVNPYIEDGQTVRLLGMVKVKGGYVALKVELDGWTATDAEILTDGAVPQHHAEDALRVAFAELFAGFDPPAN